MMKRTLSVSILCLGLVACAATSGSPSNSARLSPAQRMRAAASREPEVAMTPTEPPIATAPPVLIQDVDAVPTARPTQTTSDDSAPIPWIFGFGFLAFLLLGVALSAWFVYALSGAVARRSIRKYWRN